MAKNPAPAPTTGGQTGGGTTPPPTSEADKFRDGSILRDGTDTTDPKFKTYKADVTEGQTVQTPVDIEVANRAAALFDEQGLDPYEVYTAEYGIIK